MQKLPTFMIGYRQSTHYSTSQSEYKLSEKTGSANCNQNKARVVIQTMGFISDHLKGKKNRILHGLTTLSHVIFGQTFKYLRYAQTQLQCYSDNKSCLQGKNLKSLRTIKETKRVEEMLYSGFTSAKKYLPSKRFIINCFKDKCDDQ